MKQKPIKYNEFKQGCLYPLMTIAVACAIAIIIILICSMKGCKKGNYDYSPNAVHTVEDRTQTDEMRVFHSDKGMVSEENGLLIIKR